MKCMICDRQAEVKYCKLHERAYSNIIKKYKIWMMALEISWEKYLVEILKNNKSGLWVKEVAEQMFSSQPPKKRSAK